MGATRPGGVPLSSETIAPLLTAAIDGLGPGEKEALREAIGGGGGGDTYEITVTLVPGTGSRRVEVSVASSGQAAAFRAIRVDLMTNLADLSGLSITNLTSVWFTRQATRLGTANLGLELVGQTNADGEFAFTLEAVGIALAGTVAAIVGDSSGSAAGA